MKLWHKFGAPLVLTGLVAAAAPHSASAQSVIKIDGSSTVFPIAEAVAEEFQISKRGKVRVTVGIAGTGGGFKRFCRGETDISNASRPILKEEMEACRAAGIKYMELPVAFDALTVVVNPAEHLGQVADRGGPEEDVGTLGAEPRDQVESGSLRLPGAAADAVRSRRRFRYVRLLYGSRERQVEGEPRRLHGERRRQRSRPGRREQQERARLLRLCVLQRAQGQDARPCRSTTARARRSRRASKQ